MAGGAFQKLKKAIHKTRLAGEPKRKGDVVYERIEKKRINFKKEKKGGATPRKLISKDR